MSKSKCEYCGEWMPWPEIEVRNGRFICTDGKACDRREEKAHKQHLRSLRIRQRLGDELTEAEKHELAEP